jgi:tetratricopeptide (TPR) repeat protein
VVSAGTATQPATDCTRELRQIRAALSSGTAGAGAAGADAAAGRCYLLLRRARLSGVPDELRAADQAVTAAQRQHPHWPDLCFLRASADLDMHRPGAVYGHLGQAAGLPDSPAGLELRAAASEQLGRYAEAEDCYTRALLADPSWQALAGMAQLRAKAGERGAADALYARAEDELTAKQMSAFAWVRVARGTLAADAGDHDAAWAHYRTAAAAFSGYWFVESHIAALLRRQGRLAEAAGAYTRLWARTARPDLAQALADLHRARGADGEAARWYAVALAGYQASAARGESLYTHHLESLPAHVGSLPNASSSSGPASGNGG